MRSKIKDRKTNTKEKALALHFYKFLLCLPAFGTFAKLYKPTHNQKFVKETNRANSPLTSSLMITNWNSYDR